MEDEDSIEHESSESDSSFSRSTSVFAPAEADSVYIKMKVKVGDKVVEGDIIGEIETDKAEIEIIASSSGIVEEICVPEESEINVKDDTELVKIKSTGKSSGKKKKATTKTDTMRKASGQFQVTMSQAPGLVSAI